MKVVTHRQLLKEVRGVNYANQFHHARFYMAQLRQRLEIDPARPRRSRGWGIGSRRNDPAWFAQVCLG